MAISGLIIKPKVSSVTTSLLLTKIKWNLGNEYLEFLAGLKYLNPLNLYLFLHGNFVSTMPARVIFWHKIEKAFEIFPLPKVGLGAPPPGGLGPSGKLLAPDIPSPLRAIPIQSLPPSKFRHKFAPKNRHSGENNSRLKNGFKNRSSAVKQARHEIYLLMTSLIQNKESVWWFLTTWDDFCE